MQKKIKIPCNIFFKLCYNVACPVAEVFTSFPQMQVFNVQSQVKSSVLNTDYFMMGLSKLRQCYSPNLVLNFTHLSFIKQKSKKIRTKSEKVDFMVPYHHCFFFFLTKKKWKEFIKKNLIFK